MIPLWIGGCAAGALVAAGSIPRLLRKAQRASLLRRASADYHDCRGTEHANLLREGVDRHEAAVHALRYEIPQIEGRLDADERLERSEIWNALLRHLVAERLTEIPGIGPKLRDTLLATCFDGTLESLERVETLAGVGADKAAAIRSWVKKLRSELPEMQDEAFPERDSIVGRHQETRERLAAQRTSIEETLAVLEPRLAKAMEELASLSRITVFDFVHAMQGNTQAAERVSIYAMGVFPEWDPAPDWYEGILSDPEAAEE